ncbi:tyrosine-type recombinase/integrase [Rhodococcus sp. 66b]|uniref:tyrosine-type recombinase/integrase n=1 Tax=Rhodococcus sp. 66b TaxID=1945511 RepID=UPI001F531A5E|nr:tyrosine-type recombinase/integrase [Rhodococcus sp. 66b]MDJ0106084.1 tyrosine-type recombinase/integrase [Rhodococcus erythropolis]
MGVNEPSPSRTLKLLSLHIAHWLRDSEDPTRWLFPGEGEHPWHQNSVGYRWRAARKGIGAEHLHLHHLRHFYASGLIAAGCDVVTVQRALGHSSATVTLSTYSHLWPDADDKTRKAADALFKSSTESTAYPLRTESAK